MDSRECSQILAKKEITFPNCNRAQSVTVPLGASPKSIFNELKINEPRALIIVIGGAGNLDRDLYPELIPLFSRGIARAAAKTNALIMDGGTEAGVMSLMGQGVADQGRKSTLLGLAPEGKITYPGDAREKGKSERVQLDPNHSHFVIVDSNEWGGETDVMLEMAKHLSENIPVVTLLINGHQISKKEALLSIRQGWPLIVIKGSGRLADDICRFFDKKGKKRKKSSSIKDPEMEEILEEGNIHIFPLGRSPKELERLIIKQLPLYSNPTLNLAWERFSVYDTNAIRRQKNFNRFQIWILLLGVLTTLLVVSQGDLIKRGILKEPSYSADSLQSPTWEYQILRFSIISLPIIISILVAAANRFKSGNKWILLRASAEDIKQEIYRYRTRTNIYREKPSDENTAEEKLIKSINEISDRLMKTDVNSSAILPYKGTIPPEMYGAAAEDDGFSTLTPDKYLNIRLEDQLSYYRLKTAKLERQLKRLHWLIYLFGGLGTFLAAIGWELWVALTASLVGAFTTFLEYQQVENSLVKYNQTATNLANIKTWWTALTAEKKLDETNVDDLVENTENILRTELTGWVQQMEDALAELQAQQATKDQVSESDKGNK